MAHLIQEIVVHGWDLAVGTGQSRSIRDDVVEPVVRFLEHGADPGRREDWRSRALTPVRGHPEGSSG